MSTKENLRRQVGLDNPTQGVQLDAEKKADCKWNILFRFSTAWNSHSANLHLSTCEGHLQDTVGMNLLLAFSLLGWSPVVEQQRKPPLVLNTLCWVQGPAHSSLYASQWAFFSQLLKFPLNLTVSVEISLRKLIHCLKNHWDCQLDVVCSYSSSKVPKNRAHKRIGSWPLTSNVIAFIL